jgi:hypothetical protein
MKIIKRLMLTNVLYLAFVIANILFIGIPMELISITYFCITIIICTSHIWINHEI